jgi:choline kinase
VEKKKVEMKNPKRVKMKNGRYAMKGKDAKGHNVFRIGG